MNLNQVIVFLIGVILKFSPGILKQNLIIFQLILLPTHQIKVQVILKLVEELMKLVVMHMDISLRLLETLKIIRQRFTLEILPTVLLLKMIYCQVLTDSNSVLTMIPLLSLTVFFILISDLMQKSLVILSQVDIILPQKILESKEII